MTPHDARHAFVSQLAALDLTSADLAEIVGHTTAGITESIYTHAFDREAREQRVGEANGSRTGDKSMRRALIALVVVAAFVWLLTLRS